MVLFVRTTRRVELTQEVATLVTVLASDRTANVTGVNYVIDGGLMTTTSRTS